jgi:hypothetical protein
MLVIPLGYELGRITVLRSLTQQPPYCRGGRKKRAEGLTHGPAMETGS